MKSVCVCAGILFACAPVAFGQETPAPVASLETPIASVVRAPPPVAPSAPVKPATGWTGPVNFAPVAVVDMITRVCRPSVAGDGGDLSAHAEALGLGGSQLAPEDLVRGLPGSAVTWQAPTVDGALYLMGYGEDAMNCGAAVLRPMHEAAFNKVVDLLKAPELGFVVESTQTLPGDVRWERLKSPKGEFVDLMEYPPTDDRPGILRADYLPG